MTKIYGIYEKLGLNHFFYGELEVNEKHLELENLVKDIQDCKIGIESFGETIKPTKDKIIGSQSFKIYSYLHDTLKGKNNVLLLDTGFENHLDSLNNEFPKEKLKSNFERYKAAVKSEYYRRIGRTEVELRNIISERPDFAFVGAQHAFEMYHPTSENKIFLEFPKNMEEINNEISRVVQYSDDVEMMRADLKNIDLEYSIIPIEELLPEQKKKFEELELSSKKFERLYKFMENKHLDAKKPDFIGTWGRRCFLEGFFEMYIESSEDGHVKGTIKDCLGDAEFHGEINDESIWFNKKYKVYLDPSAASEGIHYEGHKDKYRLFQIYLGNYRFTNSLFNGAEPFILCPYSPKNQQKIINSEDIEKLLVGLAAE
jgi:hypothetical protein